jgi:mono/diheme cytochrome c family protein
MRYNKALALLLVVAIAAFSSCYYDKEEILYPGGGTCDTTAASTYSAVVLPILNSSCNSCHGGSASAGGGINLDTYTSVKAQVTNGKLMGSINHSAGYSAMPKNGAKMSACNIAKINRWIAAGSLNN